MTEYMKQFNDMTTADYTQGFEPEKLDNFYKNSGLYNKNKTQMPQQVDFTFDVNFSGIDVPVSVQE